MKTQMKKMAGTVLTSPTTQTISDYATGRLQLVPRTKTTLVELRGETMWTTSLLVSGKFNKRHDSVLRAIENSECSDEFRHHNFVLAEYVDEQGKRRKSYDITRDGFSKLAMGFTGKDAARWQEDYIIAFNNMERELLRIAKLHSSIAYQQARIGGKVDRRYLTDAMQALAERAHRRMNSTTPVSIFIRNATETVTRALFMFEKGEKVEGIRERLTARQLNRLATAEDVFADAVLDRLDSDMHHHEIYVEAKASVIAFATATGCKVVPGIDRRNAVNGGMMLDAA